VNYLGQFVGGGFMPPLAVAGFIVELRSHMSKAPAAGRKPMAGTHWKISSASIAASNKASATTLGHDFIAQLQLSDSRVTIYESLLRIASEKILS
jgi:hypothetical protein